MAMAAVIVDGRYLDSADNKFALKVLQELEDFDERLDSGDTQQCRVLVFPPLTPHCRYLIHQLVQEQHPRLCTVSVGEEPNRRLVVGVDTETEAADYKDRELHNAFTSKYLTGGDSEDTHSRDPWSNFSRKSREDTRRRDYKTKNPRGSKQDYREDTTTKEHKENKRDFRGYSSTKNHGENTQDLGEVSTSRKSIEGRQDPCGEDSTAKRLRKARPPKRPHSCQVESPPTGTTMPADVDTAAPAQHARQQRRGKIAAEIYRPPAARLQRQHNTAPPLLLPNNTPHTTAHNTPHNITNTTAHPQTRYPTHKPTQQVYAPPHHHNKSVPGGSRVAPNITQYEQQYSQQQQQEPLKTQQHHPAKPQCPLSGNAPRVQSHPNQSPRSRRRKPNNRQPVNERSSCPPEIVPAQTKTPPLMSADGDNIDANNMVSTNVPTETPDQSSVPSPGSCNMIPDTDATQSPQHCPISQPQAGPAVNSTAPNTASVTTVQDSGEPFADTPACNNTTTTGDTSNNYNSKRRTDVNDIKNLTNTIDLLSTKYFNNTACPYKNFNATNSNRIEQPRPFVNNAMVKVLKSCDADYMDFNKDIDNRRARPDQVLYVPRGLRHGTSRQIGGDSMTSEMNSYNNSRGSPLTEQPHNCRPASPALSITSVVSEFSGRQRYDYDNSRPGSRLSIYDGDEDKLYGRPPHYDRRNNSSRESTPGYGRPGTSNTKYDSCFYNNQEHGNYQTSKSPAQYRDDPFGRLSKSPTPNRDSIHSKENVMHPMEQSPKRRRARKNRKQRSRSRDHSFDSINKERGSFNNSSNSSYDQPENRLANSADASYTFYNSNTKRAEGPTNNRVGSRNPSMERNVTDDWRQQIPSSHTNSPVKSPYNQTIPNRTLNSSKYSNSNSSYSNMSEDSCDAQSPYTASIMMRRNSADKPPTGRLSSSDTRRDSISKVSAPNSPTNDTPTQKLTSLKEVGNSNTIYNTSSNLVEKVPEDNLESDSFSHTNIIHIDSAVSATNETEVVVNNTSSSSSELLSPAVAEPSSPVAEDEGAEPTPNTECDDSDDDDTQPECVYLDWAAESEKEDLRKYNLLNGIVDDAPSDDDEGAGVPDAVEEESKVEKSRASPPESYVDERTRKSINATMGQEPIIEKPRQDYSDYQSQDSNSWYCHRYSPPRTVQRAARHSPPLSRGGTTGPTTSPYPSSSPYTSSSPYADVSPTTESCDAPQPSALAHVLELYDFPASLRTQDLLAAYQGFQAAAPVDIKWVDDTHALAVFSTAAIACQALADPHPLIKARLLADASLASKTKAVRIDEALLPARPRPQTSMVLARRLLSGALGVKVNLTREERERETRAIREAKDHKRFVAKQKEDVWEGNI